MCATMAAEEGVQGVQLHHHPKNLGCKHIFCTPKNIEGALHGIVWDVTNFPSKFES